VFWLFAIPSLILALVQMAFGVWIIWNVLPAAWREIKDFWKEMFCG
jgi:hypothetical protein